MKTGKNSLGSAALVAAIVLVNGLATIVAVTLYGQDKKQVVEQQELSGQERIANEGFTQRTAAHDPAQWHRTQRHNRGFRAQRSG